MNEHISLTGDTATQPDRITRFLWWLSTAEADIIQHCKVDRNRYAITGLTVLCTWLFATLAWTYFFFTVSNNYVTVLFSGFFMGFIILCIDRALIKSINAKNKFKLLPLLFRFLLAGTIGVFMAQPALLFLFDKEVHVQLSIDNAAKLKSKQQQINTLYQEREQQLRENKKQIQSELNNKYNEVVEARKAFIAETDGTGGSGKIGISTIALAKKQQYDTLAATYEMMRQQYASNLNQIELDLQSLTAEKQTEINAFKKLMNDGFLNRIEALNNLIRNNSTLQFRYYLIVMILLLIELMPVIAKLLLPQGSYEERLALQQEYESVAAKNMYQQKTTLINAYNEKAVSVNKAALNEFFKLAEEAAINRQQTYFKEAAGSSKSLKEIWLWVKQFLTIKAYEN